MSKSRQGLLLIESKSFFDILVWCAGSRKYLKGWCLVENNTLVGGRNELICSPLEGKMVEGNVIFFICGYAMAERTRYFQLIFSFALRAAGSHHSIGTKNMLK